MNEGNCEINLDNLNSPDEYRSVFMRKIKKLADGSPYHQKQERVLTKNDTNSDPDYVCRLEEVVDTLVTIILDNQPELLEKI